MRPNLEYGHLRGLACEQRPGDDRSGMERPSDYSRSARRCWPSSACFVADIYGKGVRPTTMDCAADAGIRDNRALLRPGARRLESRKLPRTDTGKIAAIGYCFGGMTCWNWRATAPTSGVVASTARSTRRVPRCRRSRQGTGAPWRRRSAGAAPESLRRSVRQVDWQLVAYGNAVHSFTNFTIPKARPARRPTTRRPTTLVDGDARLLQGSPA